MKTRTLKLATLVGAATLAVSLSNTATALTSPQSAALPVTASVAASCSISTNAVAFGAYDPVGANSGTGSDLTNGAGSVVVNCVSGSASVTIGLGQGNNYSGGRRMLGALGGFLNYNLQLPPNATPGTACTFPAATLEWGTTAGTDTLDPADATWDGTAKTFYVCGTVPKGQAAAADNFSDSVQATVNF